ncbi:MAG: ABC transporter permease, partial [Christensenellaceae bacterium]
MGTVEITLWQLAAAYIFVIILLIIFKIRHISKKKTLVLATFRMTIQLLIAGYLLTLAFSHPSWWLTLTIFCGMLVYAGFTIRHRAPKQYRPIVSKAAFLGMICGTSIVMIYFLSLVLGIKPWYDTRSFISIAGMIVANS